MLDIERPLSHELRANQIIHLTVLTIYHCQSAVICYKITTATAKATNKNDLKLPITVTPELVYSFVKIAYCFHSRASNSEMNHPPKAGQPSKFSCPFMLSPEQRPICCCKPVNLDRT